MSALLLLSRQARHLPAEHFVSLNFIGLIGANGFCSRVAPDFLEHIFVAGCSARSHEVLCVDNFFTGARRNIEDLLNHRRFELLRQLFVVVDEIYNLACPASPIHYIRPGSDDEDERLRCYQYAWPCEAFEGSYSLGFHIRSLW